MKPLINQNFRFTFPQKTLTNLKVLLPFVELEEGLYQYEYKKRKIVLNLDSFGELRLSNETPVNNYNSLIKNVIKYIKKGV